MRIDLRRLQSIEDGLDSDVLEGVLEICREELGSAGCDSCLDQEHRVLDATPGAIGQRVNGLAVDEQLRVSELKLMVQQCRDSPVADLKQSKLSRGFSASRKRDTPFRLWSIPPALESSAYRADEFPKCRPVEIIERDATSSRRQALLAAVGRDRPEELFL